MEHYVALIINIGAAAIMGLMAFLIKKWIGSLISLDSCSKLQAQCALKNFDHFTSKEETMEFKERLTCIERKIQELKEGQSAIKEEVLKQISSVQESMATLHLELKQEIISTLKSSFLRETKRRDGKKPSKG